VRLTGNKVSVFLFQCRFFEQFNEVRQLSVGFGVVVVDFLNPIENYLISLIWDRHKLNWDGFYNSLTHRAFIWLI
jgi:hypothetical protein